MLIHRAALSLLVTLCTGISCTYAQSAAPPPATQPGEIVRFPAVTVDRVAKNVRIECQALVVDTPLEFFCVSNGGPEHESVLRTPAKPSHIHAALLMLGQEPGSPMTYSDAKKSWTPPYGPPIRVRAEYTSADGTKHVIPATRLLRHVRTHEPMKEQFWIFAGSHQRADGAYLADLTGYVVSLVNFEHTLIDVPELVSASNETLEWETNPELGLTRGQAVTMILEPLNTEPATRPSPSGEADLRSHETLPAGELDIEQLRKRWEAAVAPHERALKDAAQTHYEVIAELRHKQQALIDEADKLQRLIDELEKQYAEMTTPKPD